MNNGTKVNFLKLLLICSAFSCDAEEKNILSDKTLEERVKFATDLCVENDALKYFKHLITGLAYCNTKSSMLYTKPEEMTQELCGSVLQCVATNTVFDKPHTKLSDLNQKDSFASRRLSFEQEVEGTIAQKEKLLTHKKFTRKLLDFIYYQGCIKHSPRESDHNPSLAVLVSWLWTTIQVISCSHKLQGFGLKNAEVQQTLMSLTRSKAYTERYKEIEEQMTTFLGKHMVSDRNWPPTKAVTAMDLLSEPAVVLCCFKMQNKKGEKEWQFSTLLDDPSKPGNAFFFPRRVPSGFQKRLDEFAAEKTTEKDEL